MSIVLSSVLCLLIEERDKWELVGGRDKEQAATQSKHCSQDFPIPPGQSGVKWKPELVGEEKGGQNCFLFFFSTFIRPAGRESLEY